jgi:3-deoxy-manno-octulosonate cytidylyltransferase (CMP-KDO synthetase)
MKSKMTQGLKIIGIIPARMGSSRFPGKPLAKIRGISMVEHVLRRSRMSKSLNDVYVATCDLEIRIHMKGPQTGWLKRWSNWKRRGMRK